jgi:hypothetical protein
MIWLYPEWAGSRARRSQIEPKMKNPKRTEFPPQFIQAK